MVELYIDPYHPANFEVYAWPDFLRTELGKPMNR